VARDARFRPTPSRKEVLLLRRQSLQLRSAELRLRVERDVMRLAPSLALADRGVAGLRWLREHPEWSLGAAMVMVLLKPRRVLRWGMRLWWGWRTARRALEWIDRRR
jgi:hypothetical protein